MSTSCRRLFTALALALTSTVLVAVPALAKPWFVRDVTPETESSVLLAPGTSFLRTLEIHNRFHGNAKLYVRASHLTDDDNGCVEQEIEIGDGTCGPGQGELSPHLEISIRTVPREGEPVELWTGALVELAEDDVLLIHRLPKGSTNLFHLETRMSPEADNSTMTDQVEYDLDWTMTQGLGREVGTSSMESTTEPPRSADVLLASTTRSLQSPYLHIALLIAAMLLIVPLRSARSRPRIGLGRPERTPEQPFS